MMTFNAKKLACVLALMGATSVFAQDAAPTYTCKDYLSQTVDYKAKAVSESVAYNAKGQAVAEDVDVKVKPEDYTDYVTQVCEKKQNGMVVDVVREFQATPTKKIN